MQENQHLIIRKRILNNFLICMLTNFPIFENFRIFKSMKILGITFLKTYDVLEGLRLGGSMLLRVNHNHNI